MSKSKTITVGPFTWNGYTEDGKDYPEEVWELVLPELGTCFCLKNYGPQRLRSFGETKTWPGVEFEPFSGWRLVSGGPFTEAGCWTSRDEAMQEVIPYLVTYCRRRVQELLGETEETQRRVGVLRGIVLRGIRGA